MANGDKTNISMLWNNRFFRSIYRNKYPTDIRNRVMVILNSVALHLHPVKVPRKSLNVSYTWGLGGISTYLFLLLTVTGVLLMFYYIPSVERAYGTMKEMETDISWGMFLRNLHRWGAHGMVITVFLHMVRVFLTGSYKTPRDFNWAMGVLMLTITNLLSFTGYLLPWDQLAIWAITVGTNMGGATPIIGDKIRFLLLGGYSVGQNTLIRWYTLHVIFLPLALIVLMAVHFWRVRKDGGITSPDEGDLAIAEANAGSSTPKLLGTAVKDKVFTWPHLVSIEMVGMLVVTIVLMVVSVLVNAPLEDMANADKTPNPAKAPWYFLGLQELLLHMHAALAGVIVPGLVLILLAFIPYVDRERTGVGRYFGTPNGKRIAAFAFIYTTVWILFLILMNEFVGVRPGIIEPLIGAQGLNLGEPVVNFVVSILIPVVVTLFIPISLVFLVRKGWHASTREIMIALFFFFLASFIVLTIIGTAFRGTGMKLFWAWDLPPKIH